MSGEKTELPSEKRLQDARKKGDFPRSQIALGTASLLGAVLGLVASVPWSASRFVRWTARMLADGAYSSPTAHLAEAGVMFGGAIAGPVLGALVVGTGVAAAQAGLAFHPETVRLDFAKLNPFPGLKRLFQLKQVVTTLKALILGGIVGGMLLGWFSSNRVMLLRVLETDPSAVLTQLMDSVSGFVFQLLAILGAASAADHLIEKQLFLKRMMMSRQEVKDEYKQSEGSPEHKAHRQALHRGLAQGGPARGVQKATAVVVNPTHVAVALRYDVAECDAPYLVAKGEDGDALALRREALRLKVPIVRDVPLARSLLSYDIGEAIPEELYRAAAAVLRTAMDNDPRQPDGRTT